jgi:hypothetical protein
MSGLVLRVSPCTPCRGLSNLRKLHVAAAVEKARAKRAERFELTGDMVVDELKIGFANMADYMKSTPEGGPLLDFSRLTRDQTAALREVTVEDFPGFRRGACRCRLRWGRMVRLGVP